MPSDPPSLLRFDRALPSQQSATHASFGGARERGRPLIVALERGNDDLAHAYNGENNDHALDDNDNDNNNDNEYLDNYDVNTSAPDACWPCDVLPTPGKGCLLRPFSGVRHHDGNSTSSESADHQPRKRKSGDVHGW